MSNQRTRYTLDQLENVEPLEYQVFTSSAAMRKIWHRSIVRRMSPWGVLANVLAYVSAAIPPIVQTPPILGGYGSLNLLVGLVGSSGAGKGASQAVARELMEFKQYDRGGLDVDIEEFPLGTGQGVAQVFKPPAKDEDRLQVDRALFVATEIDGLAASTQQRGATIMTVLRQVWSGENPGAVNGSRETTRNIPAHSYRATLLCGIQPERSAALLNEHELAGGTPQRWLWLEVARYPGRDRRADRGLSDGPLTVVIPKSFAPPESKTQQHPQPVTVDVPGEVEEETVELYEQNQLKDDGSVHTHRNLTRIKVACLLAVLNGSDSNGRIAVTLDEWRIAGLVMDKSDQARQRCETALKAAESRDKTRRIVEDEVARDDARRQTAINWVRRRVHHGFFDGWVVGGAARNSADSKLRGQFPDALHYVVDHDKLLERVPLMDRSGKNQARDKDGLPEYQYRKLGR